MPRTDKDLLEKLKSRDPLVLENIFREVNPYLLRILYSHGLLEEHAEEILHESWEIFLSGLDKFEGRSQIKVFLAGIILNKIREYRRRQKRLVFVEDSSAEMDTAFTPDGWWKQEPQDPHALFQSKKVLEGLVECLEGLGQQQKEAFLLKEVEGENSEIICKILGVTITNLGVLLFRAKQNLRGCLEVKVMGEPRK